MYSFQGKGRGRRREAKNSSLGPSSIDPSKRSKADKSQSPKTPARGKPTEKMENLADDTMSSCLPVDKLEDDVPTSGLMQSDMLPGFNGESIDDYLDSDYFSTLPIQHDFDPEFYFASHCESLESTPTDSISGACPRL